MTRQQQQQQVVNVLHRVSLSRAIQVVLLHELLLELWVDSRSGCTLNCVGVIREIKVEPKISRSKLPRRPYPFLHLNSHFITGVSKGVEEDNEVNQQLLPSLQVQISLNQARKPAGVFLLIILCQ